jgi:2-hydroxy-6-oxonona-2,4-dienedioate hydrolase
MHSVDTSKINYQNGVIRKKSRNYNGYNSGSYVKTLSKEPGQLLKKSLKKTEIKKINPDDPDIKAALTAEKRLFDHYNLDVSIHHIAIKEIGIRVRVMETGTGPALLMVPGGNGIAAELIPLISYLKGHRIIAVNLPGGGLSDAVDFRKTHYQNLAEYVLSKTLDYFNLKNITIVANSLGDLWAMWLAMSKPDYVNKMILTGCPAFIMGTSAPFPMRLLSAPVLNRLLFPLSQPGSVNKMRKILHMLLHSPVYAIERLPDIFVETIFRMFHLPTYRLGALSFLENVLTISGSKKEYQLWPDKLQKICQKTLFIWGTHDPFGSADIGRNILNFMPDARLEIIDAGHVPYIDQPEKCAEIIRKFLKATH